MAACMRDEEEVSLDDPGLLRRSGDPDVRVHAEDRYLGGIWDCHRPPRHLAAVEIGCSHRDVRVACWTEYPEDLGLRPGRAGSRRLSESDDPERWASALAYVADHRSLVHRSCACGRLNWDLLAGEGWRPAKPARIARRAAGDVSWIASVAAVPAKSAGCGATHRSGYLRRPDSAQLVLGALAALAEGDDVALLEEDALKSCTPLGCSAEQQLEVHAEVLELLFLRAFHDGDRLGVVLHRHALLIPVYRLSFFDEAGDDACVGAGFVRELSGRLVILLKSHVCVLLCRGSSNECKFEGRARGMPSRQNVVSSQRMSYPRNMPASKPPAGMHTHALCLRLGPRLAYDARRWLPRADAPTRPQLP